MLQNSSMCSMEHEHLPYTETSGWVCAAHLPRPYSPYFGKWLLFLSKFICWLAQQTNFFLPLQPEACILLLSCVHAKLATAVGDLGTSSMGGKGWYVHFSLVFYYEKVSVGTVTTGCWLCRGSACRCLPVKQQLEGWLGPHLQTPFGKTCALALMLSGDPKPVSSYVSKE